MPSEIQLEIYKQQRTAQDKYVYFILAAAGACIAFAITKTQDMALNRWHSIVGLAVIVWGASFYAGIRHLQLLSAVLNLNFELSKVEAGQHPDAGNNPRMMQFAKDAIKERVQIVNNKSNRWAVAQSYLLLAGGFAYLIWHVVEMYLRIKP